MRVRVPTHRCAIVVIYLLAVAAISLLTVNLSLVLATQAIALTEPDVSYYGAQTVRLWVSEWNTGTLSVYDPQQKSWRTWALPGEREQTYAVYVDEKNKVWVSDFSANAILRFDPQTEKFERFPSTRTNANVRQMAGRPGEAWGAESGADRLVVIRFDGRSQ